jgi:enterochelin esterase-like enzyme
MVLQSENNPEYQILRLQQQGKAIPAMFVCCGTEDSLLQPVRDWISFLEQHQAPVRYQESSGEHDFDFWNPYLEPVLKFFLE